MNDNISVKNFLDLNDDKKYDWKFITNYIKTLIIDQI